MFSWFGKRYTATYPDFWQEYEKEFSMPLPQSLSEVPFVALDTETTGLKPSKDRILSIGALRIQGGIIKVQECLEIFLRQELFNPETVPIHEIIQSSPLDRISELSAIKDLLKYVKNAVIVGHHVYFDIKMINVMLHTYGLPPLKNKVIDIGILYKKTKVINQVFINDNHVSLDDLCEEFSIDTTDRHKALGDAYITGIAFLKILSRLSRNNQLNLKMLIKKM